MLWSVAFLGLVLQPSPPSCESPQKLPINPFLLTSRESSLVHSQAALSWNYLPPPAPWPHLEALPLSLVRKLILCLPSGTALASYRILVAPSLLFTCVPTLYESGFPDIFQVTPLFVVLIFAYDSWLYWYRTPRPKPYPKMSNTIRLYPKLGETCSP